MLNQMADKAKGVEFREAFIGAFSGVCRTG